MISICLFLGHDLQVELSRFLATLINQPALSLASDRIPSAKSGGMVNNSTLPESLTQHSEATA